MNSEPKKKSEKPGSNYQEEIPEGKVPEGDKVVKKPEDETYKKDEPRAKNMVYRKENDEQPVNPIKTPPKED